MTELERLDADVFANRLAIVTLAKVLKAGPLFAAELAGTQSSLEKVGGVLDLSDEQLAHVQSELARLRAEVV